MEIKLTKEESENYFHNALCNGLGQIGYSGLELDFDQKDYKKAKESLVKKNSKSICYEDVLVEMLRLGKKLKIVDIEGDGEYNREITLTEVHSRVEKTPLRHLMDMVDENDDATTADVILQTVFFEDIIFG